MTVNGVAQGCRSKPERQGSMNKDTLIAHVRKNEDGSWAPPQPLINHLEGSARLASKFAETFDSSAWGYAEGIGHDTGKGKPPWQQYIKRESGYDEEAHLETKPGKRDHSSPSAKLVEDVYGKGVGRILSYCIAGHHAGLPDWTGSQSSLSFRLQNSKTSDIPRKYRDDLSISNPLIPPWKFDNTGLDMSLWIRMLFFYAVEIRLLGMDKLIPEKGGY